MEPGKFHRLGLNELFACRFLGMVLVTSFSSIEKKRFVRLRVGMLSAPTANVPAWEKITVQVVQLGVGMKSAIRSLSCGAYSVTQLVY